VRVPSVLINMADVHVTTQSKASEEHVFKNWEPTNNKSVTNLETKEKLKKSMVETIQQM
jgi:hypothetical protein